MNRSGIRALRPLVPVLILLVLATVIGIPACAAADANAEKTRVLLYLVGSDLESGSATATDDLLAISGAYQDAQSQDLDIIVAFGGADKEGWRGMKIATIEQLTNDAQDGTFGNSGDYAYSDPRADMGSEESLAAFLRVAKGIRTADRTILIISDHGNSYDGIGVDEVTSNSLQMGDIDLALKQSETSYDPIMFDACLMGSIEVAKTVRPYTGMMLGSEEIQRGSYEYSGIIPELIKDPGMDSLALNKKIAELYFAGDAGKKVLTMSVIDVSQIPEIQESLDGLGEKLTPISETDEGLHDLKGAFNDAVRLGVTGSDTGTSVDLVSLLDNIGKKRPELLPELEKTRDLIRKAVLYERHNEYSRPVYGISIASPDSMTLEKYDSYGESVKIAPHWDAFFRNMVIASQKGDTGTGATSEGAASDGETGETGDGKSLAKKRPVLSAPGFIAKGNGSFTLSDPYDDAEVYTEYYLVNGSDVLSIGSQPVAPGGDGLYRIPGWDGRWYFLSGNSSAPASPWDQLLRFLSGTPDTANVLLLGMEYDGVTEGGSDIYYSWISYRENGESTNATLVAFANTSTGRNEFTIVPWYPTDDGDVLFGESRESFGNESLVTSYTDGFGLAANTGGEYSLGTVSAGPDITLRYATLPDGTYAAGIVAFYDADQVARTGQLRIITIRNGSVASDTIGQLRPG